MALESTPTVRRIALVLISLATVASEIASEDTRALSESLAIAGAWILVTVIASLVIPVPADSRQRPPTWVIALLIASAVAPLIVEPIRRSWTGTGSPLELQMVFALRSLGLGLAACGGWNRCLRLASSTSLFLMLFSGAMTNHSAVLVILGLYAIAGCAWLAALYRIGFQNAYLVKESTIRIETSTEIMRLPWGGISLLVIAVAIGGSLTVIGPKRIEITLGEWMPTSGGTGETDPFARYGMGDGPEEQAGDNAKAAGMVETDRMIEDNKNSLIDAVSDMYGPPHKPPKEQERTVAAGIRDIIQNHGKLPENRRPSRNFETSRKGPGRDPKKTSMDARGIFEIEGRTPLHVRLVSFDRYDASEKKWVEVSKPVGGMIEAAENGWLRPSNLNPNADWYRESERHRFKTADMSDNLAPTPSLLTRFQIKSAERPDYFEWQREGVLGLAGRKRTPPGIVVNTDCRTIDPSLIPEKVFIRLGSSGGVAPEYGSIPPSMHADFERLARDWAGEHERGWPQIEACIRRLRDEYVLDADAVPPPEHPCPELWFLLESRRGPDYLFAGSLAMMLRTLEYPTRVCLGYYASPESYDPATGHTPVRKSDLHMWAELRLRDGHWMVLEATPGFEVLSPKLPWWERLLGGLLGVAKWAWSHAVELGITLFCFGLIRVYRREIADWIAFRIWKSFPSSSWRSQMLRASTLLERRGRCFGLVRLPSQTSTAWLREYRKVRAKDDLDLAEFIQMAEWAAFAPEVAPPWSSSDVSQVCRRVLEGWPLRRWRELAVSNSSVGV